MCAIRYTNIAEIKIRRYKREKNAQIQQCKSISTKTNSFWYEQ